MALADAVPIVLERFHRETDGVSLPAGDLLHGEDRQDRVDAPTDRVHRDLLGVEPQAEQRGELVLAVA